MTDKLRVQIVGWGTLGLILIFILGVFLGNLGTDTSHHPSPVMPAGICVLTSPDYTDATVIATVTPGHIHAGIITCDAGVWVPTTPVGN